MVRTRGALGALVFVCAVACQPPDKMEGGGDGGGPDAYQGPVGTVRGTVWAPGQAPGMVPADQEIPISGAMIWLSAVPPLPIPQEVYCDQCVASPGITSDAKGQFTISGKPGTYWMMIQKGQFRIDQEITLVEDAVEELAAERTMLPTVHDPGRGLWRPRIALAEGLWDDMENIVGKMGFGAVDALGELRPETAAGNFDLYVNGSAEFFGYALGDLYDLVSDVAKMKQYHIIFIPCSDGDNGQLFGNPQIRDNIREYVAAGGKFYVTDWSAEWEDVVYPEFIQFAADHDTSSRTGPFSSGDGFPGYTSEQAKAMDPDLALWLHGQVAPLVSLFGEEVGSIDAQRFSVEGNYDHIRALGTVDVGVNAEGMPRSETAYAWVMGDDDPGEGPVNPLTVTFEPGGCGRVLYSTYHTAGFTHVGLMPQERVLLYLIMEIGECLDDPIVE